MSNVVSIIIIAVPSGTLIVTLKEGSCPQDLYCHADQSSVLGCGIIDQQDKSCLCSSLSCINQRPIKTVQWLVVHSTKEELGVGGA
jgi:hypothetical protein